MTISEPATTLTSQDELRAVYPDASFRSSRKVIDHLDTHCRRFIGLSPFCVLSTVGPDGSPDLSPRGGEPGFVQVSDDHTAVLADRPGNYRLDNLANAVTRPSVALLFLVPGIDETLRVYGRASVLTLDDDRRVTLGVDGKGRTELRIAVTRAYFHCAKALMRSRLWDPDAQVDRDVFPTMGELMNDHAHLSTPAETQEEMLDRFGTSL
jgi:PPOX class probable FMN-dependent enzyme